MRIAVIGTGRIANVYAGASAEIAARPDGPRIELIGGYDRAGNRVEGIEPVASLAALIDLDPDAFILSTGTTAHLDAYRELRELAPRATVWFEKPVVYTAAQLADSADVFADPLRRTMYHAADAPEVEWAAGRWDEWIGDHGPVVEIRAFFSDPYSTTDTSSYVNSWLDSGVNAMSVLQRLVGITGEAELVDHGDAIGAWTGQVDLVDHYGQGELCATITTQWKVAVAAKQTEIAFEDETCLNLDHQAVAGRVIDPVGTVTELFGSHATVPRMVQHYLNVFDRLLVDRHLFSAEQELQIHGALTAAPTPSIPARIW